MKPAQQKCKTRAGWQDVKQDVDRDLRPGCSATPGRPQITNTNASNKIYPRDEFLILPTFYTDRVFSFVVRLT